MKNILLFLYFRKVKSTKKNTPKIIEFSESDCFCMSKDYCLYAVQSSNPLLQIAAQIRNSLPCDISYIGDYIHFSHEAQPHFAVFHTHIDKGDPLDVYLIENKTLRYNQEQVGSIQEKGSPFDSLSLFKEYFYIFNAGRLTLHKWGNADVPYLILISSLKETDISDLKASMEKTFQCSDMTSVVFDSKNKSIDKIAQMCYTLEMLKTQAIEARHRHIISGEMGVPTNSVPRKYENIPIQVTLNEDYLKILQEDQTFERFASCNSY